MLERCDHNRFSAQLTERLTEHRVREIAAFERRANGGTQPSPNPTAATAAKVAPQPGAIVMNVHQTDRLSRPSSLFRPAEITTAKLKMAAMGFQGSGKTYTATETAIGLVQMMKEMKLPEGKLPIAFADTEKGSRWVLPKVQAAGIEMIVAKTRAFSDLVGLVGQAENSASVLLVDSLTHFWTELCDTYCARKAAQYKAPTYRLQFQDWAFLKGEWRKFTDRFVNSNLHIIVCGRAGFEYDFIEDEDTHKKQLEKTGIKFKAEGEMGYEPDLLVLMERKMNMATKADEHVAHVVKDRSTLLDGKEIIDPTFKDFLPHIECLNLAGRQMVVETGVDISRTSAASIPADAPRDRGKIQREIVIDEIADLLLRHNLSGTAVAEKQKRSELVSRHFGTASKTEIEELMPLSDLRAGFDAMYQELEKRPSRYDSAIARDAESIEINDSLPAFATLGQATGKVIAETMVPAAVVDTATVSPNGIPAFLDRTVPKEGANPAFDESKWLAELTKAFGDVVDFVDFGEKQQTLMAPVKLKVAATTWKKAVKIATACMTRLMADQPGGGSAVAAQ